MRVLSVGHLLFAGSLAALGLLSLISGDFASVWQPVPAWVPFHEPLARLSGLLLLAGGTGAFFKRTATASVLLLTINMALWVLLLQLPRVIARPEVEAMWLGFAETLVMVAGGWILTATLAIGETKGRARLLEPAVAAALTSFALALPVIGLSHFVYLDATAALVPSWLPHPQILALLTGTAHMVAGFSLFMRALPRAIATLEALMMSTFTLVVWLPRVIAEPASRAQWTAFLVSATLSGAAWAVASEFARRQEEREPDRHQTADAPAGAPGSTSE
jgi:uncharacterized membrane protein